MSGFTKHLSYANVVATLCLFLLLGAGAHAAGLAKNSVKSKHIKDGQVKTVDLASNAVNGSKVGDSTLTGADVASNTLTGADVAPDTLTGADALQAYLRDHAPRMREDGLARFGGRFRAQRRVLHTLARC